jgi:hypothetical protein
MRTLPPPRPDDPVWDRLSPAHEDWSSFTSIPWRGEGRRWFRSPNVIPLERYRSREDWQRIVTAIWPRRW